MSYRDDDWAVDRPDPDLYDDRPSRRDFAADEAAADALPDPAR